MSFYKLFGLPTNLGALLVRKSVADIARKEYFGGGTVSAITATRPWQVFKRALSERYQDGSVPYYELLAVDCGFNYVEKTFGSWDAISAHTLAIAQYIIVLFRLKLILGMRMKRCANIGIIMVVAWWNFIQKNGKIRAQY